MYCIRHRAIGLQQAFKTPFLHMHTREAMSQHQSLDLRSSWQAI